MVVDVGTAVEVQYPLARPILLGSFDSLHIDSVRIDSSFVGAVAAVVIVAADAVVIVPAA